MHFTSVTLSKNTFWIFLTFLALVAMILGGVATSRYGAGVASDSAKYLSVAQNLLDGKGLTIHRGEPLLSWPPLYSIVLSGLSLLTGLDVFVAGWYFNVFLIGLNLFLSGVIFHRVFLEKPVYACLASLFVLLSMSSLRIHATISSDPLYLTLTLGFLLAVDDYIRERSYRAFAWMVLFSVLAPLQRYVGLAVAVTAEVVILVENRKSIRVLLRDGFVLGLATILPIGWWIFVHNIMTHGTLWGTGPAPVDAVKNTTLALTKMLHWFVPYHPILMPILTRPLIPLGALALVLVLLNIKTRDRWRAWWQALTASSVYPSMVSGFVYFAAVALTILTGDHLDLLSDRYYVILLVPTTLFILLTFDTLIMPHLRFSTRQVGYAFVAIFALWMVYPVYSIAEYLASARVRGEPSSYNMFNTRTYHEMGAVSEMQRLRELQPDEIFYSNYVDAVWFYTRKPVALLPFGNVADPAQAYAGWPYDQPGYIVWFEPNEYKHYLSPQEIGEFADVELIYQSKGGKIYYVRPR